jgi:hypothetical protein
VYLRAVALDCEMGTAANDETELIRLTAVDFFTGQVLIDNLVYPSVPMLHYDTKYSGVTKQEMMNAVRSGSAILGRERARAASLQFVGLETVVVVRWERRLQSLKMDPSANCGHVPSGGLSWREGRGGRTLQNLCKQRLGINIRVRDPAAGKLGHDSYQDAMAARELCLRWI